MSKTKEKTSRKLQLTYDSLVKLIRVQTIVGSWEQSSWSFQAKEQHDLVKNCFAILKGLQVSSSDEQA